MAAAGGGRHTLRGMPGARVACMLRAAARSCPEKCAVCSLDVQCTGCCAWLGYGNAECGRLPPGADTGGSDRRHGTPLPPALLADRDPVSKPFCLCSTKTPSPNVAGGTSATLRSSSRWVGREMQLWLPYYNSCIPEPGAESIRLPSPARHPGPPAPLPKLPPPPLIRCMFCNGPCFAMASVLNRASMTLVMVCRRVLL